MAKVNNTSKHGQRKAIVTLKLKEISFLTFFKIYAEQKMVKNESIYIFIDKNINIMMAMIKRWAGM